MIDGILLVDKEVDKTSYDVIRKLKKVLEKGQKIGHAGTLDPFATGLLIVLLGRATKLMNEIHSLDKEYVVTAQLGIATDTQDITGEVVNKSNIIPDPQHMEEIINESFIGNVSQIPPKYSAKKIHGKKAYELARKGVEFEIKPKDIHVNSFEILNYQYPLLTCKINCSTGTYVRTLMDDLGKKLGCFATASQLRRTSIGNFNISEAVRSEDINESVDYRVIGIDKLNERIGDGKR